MRPRWEASEGMGAAKVEIGSIDGRDRGRPDP